MSASGHKRPLRPIIAQRPLPGVKQPFLSSRIDDTLRLDRECLLSPKADIQSGNMVWFSTSDFWYGPGFSDHLVRRDNALGGVSWQEGSVIARSLKDKH